MFSRQHYEAIANILGEQLQEATPEQVDAITNITNKLIKYFETDNQNFYADKFRKAIIKKNTNN